MDYIIEDTRIYANDNNGRVIAEITFPKKDEEGNVFCIDHTFVDDSLRGQGVAGTLVSMAVERIKNMGGEVTATCSYAAHWLEKNR